MLDKATSDYNFDFQMIGHLATVKIYQLLDLTQLIDSEFSVPHRVKQNLHLRVHLMTAPRVISELAPFPLFLQGNIRFFSVQPRVRA